ncbi:MAG: hypothetical protein KJ622_18080 [Alphaproteobacteria bacterium]|nr:hypothetical protein [Alphaproteobacteria bacterium]
MIEFEPALRTILEMPLSQFVRSAVWAYPILEMLHILGLGLLFGPIIIYDLRVIGIVCASNPNALAALLLPWVWTGFTVNATSGFLLFASDAIEFAANPAFQAKMALILLAGLNAAVFQYRASRCEADREAIADTSQTSGMRLQAAISILLWLSVIVAGRLIAYVA